LSDRFRNWAENIVKLYLIEIIVILELVLVLILGTKRIIPVRIT